MAQQQVGITAIKSIIDVPKDETGGAISPPLRNPAVRLREGRETWGSISQTLGSPLALWRCWVFPPIGAPFPALPVPLLPSVQTPSPPFCFRPPVPFEHGSVSLYLSSSLFFFPLSSQLILLLSHSRALFLSPSLSCHDIGLWHVWENFCGAPSPREGHWYTESAGWRGLFWELVNMRTSSPKVHLHPRGLLRTRSNTEAKWKRAR